MKIAISVESTNDLPKELLEKYDIKTSPFTILLGDDMMEDGDGIAEKIFDYVGKTKVLPKTSAINDEQYKEFFDKVLQEYDAIVHISLGSELSSACQNAKRTAQDYPNVRVVDSQSLSTGIALLAIYARQLADTGFSIDEIKEKTEARVPYVQASFILKRLDYLYKGGRCSRLQLFGANLLKLRLQIVVDNGKMAPAKKFRGSMDNCIMEYCKETLETYNNPDKDVVFITYSSADEAVLNKVKELLTEKGFKNIYTTRASGTITSHCGEDCLGILYINDGGNNK
jgi:DegV family protein with EDD domain